MSKNSWSFGLFTILFILINQSLNTLIVRQILWCYSSLSARDCQPTACLTFLCLQRGEWSYSRLRATCTSSHVDVVDFSHRYYCYKSSVNQTLHDVVLAQILNSGRKFLQHRNRTSAASRTMSSKQHALSRVTTGYIISILLRSLLLNSLAEKGRWLSKIMMVKW